MDAVFDFYAFAIGAVIGSFLNVVIHRYPREESVVFPPSRCPRCRARIRWHDNIPVISWLLLLGRCRDCHSPIDVRYPLVETANGLFYLAIFIGSGATLTSLLLAALVSATIVLIFIDAEIQVLPDAIDLPGTVAGIGVGFFVGREGATHLTTSVSLFDSIVGAVAGAAILLMIALTYRLLRHVDGMGLGDVKMLAMIGSVVGWEALFPVLLFASVAGALVGLVIVIRGHESGMQFPLPFGVFLGFAFLSILFFGSELTPLLPALRFGR